MLIDIRQPGRAGSALAFLALCKVGFVFGVLCALQCAKNSVGSCRQSHECMNMCRMFNRVTYNVKALAMWRHLLFVQPGTNVE